MASCRILFGHLLLVPFTLNVSSLLTVKISWCLFTTCLKRCDLHSPSDAVITNLLSCRPPKPCTLHFFLADGFPGPLSCTLNGSTVPQKSVSSVHCSPYRSDVPNSSPMPQRSLSARITSTPTMRAYDVLARLALTITCKLPFEAPRLHTNVGASGSARHRFSHP